MAYKTYAELENYIDVQLPTNDNQEISAGDMRQTLKEIISNLRLMAKPPYDIFPKSITPGMLDSENSYVITHKLGCDEPEVIVYNDSGEKVGEAWYTITKVDDSNTKITFNEPPSVNHHTYTIKLTNVEGAYGDNIVVDSNLEMGDTTLDFWYLEGDANWTGSTVELYNDLTSEIYQEGHSFSAGERYKIEFDVITAKTEGTTIFNIGYDDIDVSELVKTTGTKTIYHTLQKDDSSENIRIFAYTDGSSSQYVEIDNIYVYPEL